MQSAPVEHVRTSCLHQHCSMQGNKVIPDCLTKDKVDFVTFPPILPFEFVFGTDELESSRMAV